MSAAGRTTRWWDSPFDWMRMEKSPRYDYNIPVSKGIRWRLYQLGFHRLIEYECVEGYDIGTAHLPGWAKSPTAGIVGTWHARRERLYWHFVPVWRWRDTGRQAGMSAADKIQAIALKWRDRSLIADGDDWASELVEDMDTVMEELHKLGALDGAGDPMDSDPLRSGATPAPSNAPIDKETT